MNVMQRSQCQLDGKKVKKQHDARDQTFTEFINLRKARMQ